ncbi:MAG: hypothetical protein K0S71_211 [Clostridia bacterium]|jgi:hypothetical protein|nr:hypothetical protein [Clostridia bacterium]
MEPEGNNTMDVQELFDTCRKMMSYHTVLRMKDGTEIDGIIISVEPDHVNLLVGEDVMYREDENGNGNNEQRQYSNLYSNQYGNQYGNRRRVRRFRRRQIPLAELLLLSLLPYPYYSPPYPYYPPYSYYPNFPY